MASRPSNYFGMGIKLNGNGNVFSLQFSINWRFTRSTSCLKMADSTPTVGDEAFIGSWIRFFRALQSLYKVLKAPNTQIMTFRNNIMLSTD